MGEFHSGCAVDADDVATISPWMSTLWVVLLRVDMGNQCQDRDWFTLSLKTLVTMTNATGAGSSPT